MPIRRYAPAIAAAACGAVVALAHPSPATLAAAIVLVLVLPGTVLVALLGTWAGWAERLVVALTGTLVAVALTAIALDAAGLRVDHVTLGIVLGTLEAAGLAAVARRRTFAIPPRLGFNLLGAVFLITAAAIAAAAITLASTPLPAPAATQGYTELSITPGRRGSARVLVSSSEVDPKAYRLVIEVNGVPAETLRFGLSPGGRRSAQVPGQLMPMDTVTAVLSSPSGGAGQTQYVTRRLG